MYNVETSSFFPANKWRTLTLGLISVFLTFGTRKHKDLLTWQWLELLLKMFQLSCWTFQRIVLIIKIFFVPCNDCLIPGLVFAPHSRTVKCRSTYLRVFTVVVTFRRPRDSYNSYRAPNQWKSNSWAAEAQLKYTHKVIGRVGDSKHKARWRYLWECVVASFCTVEQWDFQAL